MVELRLRALFLVFAVEACLQRRSRRLPSLQAFGVVGEAQRLPAPLQFDRRHHDRARLLDQRLGLRQQRVGLFRLRGAALDRLDPLLRQPSHAAILVLRAVGQPAQRSLLDDPLGGSQPHRCVRRRQRDLGQQILAADRLDRGAPPLAVDAVEPAAERLDDRQPHLRLGVGLPDLGERDAVGAAARRGGPHLGRRIGAQQPAELGRFRRQFGDAEQALRRLGVFVQRRDEDRLEIAVAERAEQRGAGQAEQLFVLYDGRRYEGVPGSNEWRVVEFAEHGIPVRMPEFKAKKERRAVKPTAALIGSDSNEDRAELAWRIAVPVMAAVLMVLAVPLAKLRPRQGRFARVGLAVLAYFLYSNLVATVRVWIEKDSSGGALGMWWVHLLPLLAAAWLLWREERPGPLLRRRRARA